MSNQEVRVVRRHLLLAVVVLPLIARGLGGQEKQPKRAGFDWWSLQKLCSPGLPLVRNTSWVRNPIDAFVLANLEKHGLAPAPPADRTTLIRRATYDLNGLPPTPAEIDAFVNDPSPCAYERLIDRLLASPHYGERWARHWLDVARFGESQGYERDKMRDHAWRYRDYVVQSFNYDKPYARFVTEQIAGDVHEPVNHEGIIATGFLVCGPWDEVGNEQQGALSRQRVREEELEDIVSVVGQTFLGLTVNCARCHNHKFDPIPQEDYYRLKAALAGVFPGDRAVLTEPEAKEREAKIAALEKEKTRLEKQIAAIEQEGREKVLKEKSLRQPAGLPVPLARWTFSESARDTVGNLHASLHGGAVLAGGRLRLNGKDAFSKTAPLNVQLREKTLEAWVALAKLNQQGGAAISVETNDGKLFDAIVFGEREPRKWVAGSEFFRRTLDLQAPLETAGPAELIHVAIAYSDDNRISVYRNGVPYAPPYQPSLVTATLQTYPSGTSHVLFGLRHTGAGNGYLSGEIAEARLYGRTLAPAEVAASYAAGISRIPLDAVLGALTVEQRGRRAELIRQLATNRAAFPPEELVYAVTPKRPKVTHVLGRGDVEKPKEIVAPGGLSALASLPSDFGLAADAPEAEGRRRLAEWIASPQNPLTARVLVNRVWHYHFGRGLVGTPNDFGFNGDRPTHPELLDWLANEFLAAGGSIKNLHRLILLSNTYQQSADFNETAAVQDAENRWLWRYPARRLEGEAIRDAMLAVSGQLNPRMGGASFKPFTSTVFNSTFYTLIDPTGPEFNRRTLYRMSVNSAKAPLLDALDCPDPSTKTPKRSVTTTPLQALSLMNNAFVLRQSQGFAERIVREVGRDPITQTTCAYRLAFGRPPTVEETRRAAAFLQSESLASLCMVLLNANEFMYVR